VLASVYGDVTALAVDTAGNLYVAGFYLYEIEWVQKNRIQKRDAQGNWTDLATDGIDAGQVFSPRAVALDGAGNLYVADHPSGGSRIQKLDARGNWSIVAASGTDLGQASSDPALALDTAGNLYVAEGSRMQVRDAQGTGPFWQPTAPQPSRRMPLADCTSAR
jgi:DNA-binding beta-propeller fold protein YncE